MRSTKLKTRLNKITEALEARGIGSFCDCPHPDGLNAKRIIASRLFPEIDWDEEPMEVCDHHKPKPMQKPKTLLGDILLRIFPSFPPWIQSEDGFATPLGSSFAEAFTALPLETRLERLAAIAPENGRERKKELKESRFDMTEYTVQ